MEANPQERAARTGRNADLSRPARIGRFGGPKAFRTLLGLGASVVLAISAGQDQFTPKSKGTTTFYGDVLPIFERACLGCHYPGGPSPFDLGEYKSAAPRALTSSYIAVRRQMPLCDGVSDFGHLGSGPSLSQKELLTIKQWADEKALKGSFRRTKYPKVPEFGIKADETITVKAAHPLPPDGPPTYVDIPLKVTPALSGDYTGLSLSNKNGFFCRYAAILRKTETIATAALGYRAMDLIEPAGFHLTTGEQLIVRVRFHPTGKAQPAQARLGLRRAISPVLPLESLVVEKKGFTVPAGERGLKVVAEKTLEKGVKIVSIVPHGSYLATRLSITALSKDGTRKLLLGIPEWNVLTAGAYNFSSPVALEPGTVLRAEITFDNSTGNSLNPFNPPRDTHSGRGPAEPTCRVEFICQVRAPSYSSYSAPRPLIAATPRTCLLP